MILGIVISNETEKLELGVDNETGFLKERHTVKGAWSPWQRLDVKRKGNADTGELDEAVFEATQAKTAQTAQKLAHPVTLMLGGQASGSCSFDGSKQKVRLDVSIADALDEAVSKALKEHVAAYHKPSVNGNERWSR